MDTKDELEILRGILEKKKNKEDVDYEELESVGLTEKSRIKDIENAIKAVRKKVSASTKKEISGSMAKKEEVEKPMEEESDEENRPEDDNKRRVKAIKVNSSEQRKSVDTVGKMREVQKMRGEKGWANELNYE